jgi:predicted ATP-grasp superfamily ATP-dependent carboligase
MLPLSLHRELITAARGRMVLPPDESVQRAVDKLETTRLAKSLGFITPETTLILEREHARDLAKSLRYPVVMKQRRSEEISSAGAMSTGGRPRYACNPQQFMSAYEGLRRHGPNVLAQEFIDGSGRGYFALVRHGEIVAEFGHRRLRDVHPTGSGSSVRLSVDLPAQIKEAGAAILRSLDWHGVAMVEFCVRHDGTPVFMEVNGRFWTSLALAVHAGVDFPTLLVGMADERAYTAIDGYRVGVRCRWLLGDVRHFMGVWYGKPEGYPGMFPKRLPTLLSILTPVPGTLHDNFCWRDPMPEVGDWLDFTCRRLPQKLRALFVD